MTSKEFKSLSKNLTNFSLINLFLKEVIRSFSLSEDLEELANSKIQTLPWQEYYEILARYIEETIDSLPNTRTVDNTKEFPSEGLVGLYFCIGDDGRSFCLCGSLYFDEEDWAAQADYYPEHECLEKIYIKLRDQVEDLLYIEEDKRYLLSEEKIEELFFSFSAYLIFNCMKNVSNKQPISNTGIALGYSHGNEIILGNFSKGIFLPNIKYVDDVGYTKPPREFPTLITKIVERGPIWDYVHFNYGDLLKEENLLDKFYAFGEVAAKEIVDEMGSKIFVNYCRKCGNIKKTPRARLCLQCGDFVEDVPNMSSIKKFRKWLSILLHKLTR
ncbi:MAG: hypothetical protein K2X02_08435 [Alphaproteobacteria bacterium]|nr:hypothetical protein [Alphaproteobacteria bacterium]